MRALILSSTLNIRGGSFSPASRRFLPVERDVLLVRKKIEHRARYPSELGEVGERSRIDIDTPQTAKAPRERTHACLSLVETFCAAAEPGEEVKVTNLDIRRVRTTS